MRKTITFLLIAVIMSAMLAGCPPPPGPCVTLYQDANYSGAGTSFLGTGSYNLNNFNDRTSSLRVGGELCLANISKVTLFEHADYQGRSIEFTGDVALLSDFNDIASSIKIE